MAVISEAGRFFADLAFTLATKIIGKLVRDELREYWISDGKYGSFGWLSNEQVITKCRTHICTSASSNNQTTYKSTVFRPTCTAVGKVNDWLVFPDKRANTLFVEPISMDLAMLPFELKFSVRIQAHTACEYENEVILLHGFASEVTQEIKNR